MEIYLIRHSTPDIPKGVCYGQADIDVTASFKAESGRLTDILPKDPFKSFSSPLLRCIKMADRISNDYIVDDRLKEMSFGEWEEKAWNSIDEKTLNEWMNDFVNNRPPGGESFNDLMKRVLEFWNELTYQKTSNTYVIYTHGGVIRSVVAHLLSMPLDKVFNFHLEFASVTKVGIHNQQFRLEYLNH